MKQTLKAGLAVVALFAGNALAQQPYERNDTQSAYPEYRAERDWRETRGRQTQPRTYDSHDPRENSAIWGVGA